MAEKELAILLTAKNMASGVLGKVTRDVSTLDRVSGRAGKGIRTLGTNLRNMAIGAGVGVAVAGFAAIKSGLDSLAERENVISATTAAIEAQGAAATVTAGEVRNWSEELERATGAAVDDKAIQASANTLIRFGTISHDTFQRALADATDLGAGLKTGPEAGAKLLGKALSDPAKAMGALKKAGVVLTKEEEDRIKQLVKGNKIQEAQVVILEAVEKRYKGAAAASAGPYQRALNLLADASEDAKMALAEGFLPIIEKVADRLSTALADPKTIDDIRGLGKSIAGAFDAVLDASANIPWDSIKSAMQMAGTGAKAAFDLFTGLPPWVQTAVLTGWGLNKLTGGAVGGIVSELGKGLIRGVLGMNAGVVNINAGVVNGGPGGGIPPVAAAGAGLGLAGSLVAGGGILAGAGAISYAATLGNPQLARSQQLKAQAPSLNAAEIAAIKYYEGDAAYQRQVVLHLGKAPSRADFESGKIKLAAGPAKPGDAAQGLADQRRGERGGPIHTAIEKELAAVERLESSTAPSMKSAEAHLAQLKTLQAGQAGRDATYASQIVAAINSLKAVIGRPPNVTFTMSAGDIIGGTNRRNRVVKPGGPRHAVGAGPLA